MSAYPFEYELAKTDGAHVPLRHGAASRSWRTDGHVAGLKLAQDRAFATAAWQSCRARELIEPFDLVLKAVGQEKQAGLLTRLFPGLTLDARGRVAHDPATVQTSLPKVFAGGDCGQRRPRGRQRRRPRARRRPAASTPCSPGARRERPRPALPRSACPTAPSAPASTTRSACANWRRPSRKG